MKRKGFYIFIGLLFAFFASQAQVEICDNGIDDDGDTFIDIADPDCAEFYGLTFLGENADCSVDPPDSGIDFFSLGEAPIKSSQNTVDDQSKIVVGDVDNDGIPDAVATTRWGFQLSVFATTNGQDDGKDEGDEKSTFKFSNSEPIFNTSGSKITPELEVWIADIGTFDASGNFVSDTPDGLSELFATGAKRVANGTFVEDYFFVAFTYQPDDLVPIYDAVFMSQTSPGPGSTGFNDFRPGIPGITDFDGDGKAEIYLKNRIYAAETGFLLADGGGDWISQVNSAPVAANIIKSSNSLELICGTLIYDISSVNLTNRTPGAPTALTPTLDMNAPAVTKLQSPGQPAWTSAHPRIYPDPSQAGGSGNKPPPQNTNYSSTSVADVNNDGTLDVFISGALDNPNGFTAVFYWDIVASSATAYEPIDPDDLTNWAWGTGIVNLKDLDGDAKVEANFVAGDHLFALEESGGLLIEMWTSDLKDALSGIVATTVYDFENDGRPEIVVRDSKELRMHDGLTGVLVNSPPACESHTLTEGPIVVDINGDGDTDICVSCFTGPGKFKPADNAQAKLGGINLFNSTTSNWLPTRRVWNQGPYFVVNIRDDLSVPFPMGDQTTIFGTGACDNGLPGPQRPLNMFLNQTPTLGPGGCPIYPAPDIAFGGIDPRDPLYDPNLMPGDPGYIPPTIEVIPPVCGELEITVNFNITNTGSLVITDDIPVSFWAVDPTDPSVTAADRLHTEILSVVNFQIGELLQFSNIVFNSTGEAFTLYIVLNDEYVTTNQADLPPFLPLTLDDPTIQECDINNNIYDFPIVPQPFVVQTTSTPNVQCDSTDPNEPENGTITAVVFEGGVETLDYGKFGFQWYTGNDTLPANAIPGPQGTKRLLEGDFSPDPGVADGLYTLVVTNLGLGCKSLPLTDTVALDDLKPDITLNLVSHQTQCERPPDKSADGAIDAVITGGPLGAIWEFNWVDDNLNPYNITTQNATGLSKGIYILEVTLQGSSCIFNSEPLVVEGPEIPDPVAITVSDATDCSAPNGEVTAQALISGVPQDTLNYDFIWRVSDVNFITNGSLLDPVAKNPTRKGLDAGYYVVQVVDKNTGCESAWAITQVGDQIKIPAVTLTELAPQTSCDPLNPNGRIQVDISIDGIPQDPALFTIEWFRGDNTIPPVHANTSGVNGEIAEGVDALVEFTVRVTSAQNCEITDKLQITESKPVFAITAITMTPNSTCDPLLATSPFSGALTVDEITVDGVPTTDFTGLTFIWYEGNNIATAIEIVGETSSSITQREDMDYLVLVTQDNTTCASPDVLNTITAIEDLPVIDIVDIPETTCTGTPNGQLTAGVDVGGPIVTAGYTYTWYDGLDTSDPAKIISNTTGAEDETIIELEGGKNYSVVVVNNTTGCTQEDFFFLGDQSKIPTASAVSTPNAICDPALTVPAVQFGGTATATILIDNVAIPVPDYADYTFTWYAGPTTGDPVIAGQTLRTITNQQDGVYTFVAQNNLGCSTSDFQVTITKQNITVTPTLNIDFQQSSCDPLNPNGQLTASALSDGVPSGAGYSYQWYVGNSPLPPSTLFVDGTDGTISGADGETILDLAANTYGVLVTDLSNGCQAFNSEIITQQLPVIDVTIINSTPNTICDPALTVPPIAFNGSIEVAVTLDGAPITPSDWEVTISGTTNDLVPVPPTTNAAGDFIFEQIDGGNYDFTAQRITTGPGFQCISPVENFVLTQTPSPLTAAITIDAEQTSCGAPNGQLTAAAGGGSGNYTYEWFVGGSTTDPPSVTFADPANGTISGVDGEIISALAADTYAVLVTDLTSGCQFTASEIISLQLPIIDVTIINSTPNTICDPLLTVPPVAFNGSIEVDITLNGAPITPTDWEVTISGTTNDLVPVPPTTNAAGDFIFTQLDGGNYDFTAQRITTGVGFQCISPPENFVLTQTPSPLTAAITIDAEQTSCGAPNGQLTASAGGGSGNYTYEWFVGGSTTDPPSVTFADPANGTISGVDGEIISALAADTYAVLVTDLTSGCQFTASEIISLQLPIIDVTIINSTPNTICDPLLTVPPVAFNGSIEVDITLNGAPITPTDWEVTISGTTNDLVPVPPTTNAAGDFIFTQLDGGNYDFTAQRITTGVGFQCISPPENFVLTQTPSPLTAAITIDAEQTSCGAPNGQLTASAGGGSGNYTYEWFVGGSTTDPPSVTFADPANGTISGVDGEIISALAADTYAVLVTDLTSGCQFTASEIISLQLPIIDVTIINSTPNTICDPLLTVPPVAFNGSIEVDITLNGAPITPTDWEVTISGTTNDLVPVPPTTNAAGDFIFTQLDGGNYDFTAQRITTGVGFQCISPPENFVLTQTPSPLTAAITIDAEQTSCGAPNGQLTASAGGGSGNYTYEWFVGGSTTDPPSVTFADPANGTISGVDGEIISALAADTYAVLVTDLTSGCQFTASEIVSQQLPVIAVSIVNFTANSICDPALTNPPVLNNGSIEVDVTLNGAPVTPSDWEVTINGITDDLVPVGPTTNAAGDFVFTQLDGGNYDFTAQRITTGVGFQCVSPPENFVLTQTPSPLTASITIDADQTSCDALNPNGQLTAAGVAGSGNYRYDWFIGGSTTDPPSTAFVDGVHGTIAGAFGEIIQDLDDNTYAVLITDLSNGCQITASEIVSENLPVIALTLVADTPNSICDPTLTNPAVNYNGSMQISVTLNGVPVTPADWELTLSGMTNEMVVVPPTTNAAGDFIFTQLDGGNYDVTAQRVTAGVGFQCTSPALNHNLAEVPPVITPIITIDADQTSCGSPNGELSISTTTIPANVGGYSYQWFKGNSTNPVDAFNDPADGTIKPLGEGLLNVAARKYTVIVTDLDNGCQVIVSDDIIDDINDPFVPATPVALSPNTVCNVGSSTIGNFTGSITVDVEDPQGTGPVPDITIYEFDWYIGEVGSMVFDQTIIGDPNYTQLAAGKYTVIVRNSNTSCESNPQTFTILDNFTFPDITLTPTSQTSCNPADLNGEINMSVLTGGIPSADGYTYVWYVGNSSIVPPSSLFINGADGVFAGPPGDEETIVSALGTNFYTVIALDQTTGCSSQETIFIGEAIVDPILNVAVANHSDCSLDGSLTPSITNLGPSPNFVPAPDGFIYHWYKGQDQSGGVFTTTTDDPTAPNPDPELSTANGTIATLYSGYYTVQAEDIHANCLSETVTVFIDRPPVVIDILFETNFLPSVCNDVEGIVTAWVDLDGNATSSAAETDYSRFTFQWFVEQPTDPLANYYTEQPPVFLPPAAPSNIGPDNSLDVNDINLNNPQIYPANIPGGAVGNMYPPDSQFEGATLYGRKDGRYTVVVFDNITGCKEFLTIDLPYAGAHAESTVLVSDVSRCDTHPLYPDGTLTVGIDPLTLGVFASNQFEHLVYQGNNPDPNYSTLALGFYTGTEIAIRVDDGIVPIPPAGFEANAYSVVARNLVNGCFSTPKTILLDSAARQPVITEVARNDNSFCSPSATELGDGFIEVAASLDPDDNTTGVPYSYGENYTFTWTYNGGALDPQMDVVNAGGFIGNRLENLPSGDYEVTVSRDETFCDNTQSFTIYDQIIPPEITAAAPGDNTGCNPWTGTILIQNADITPVPANMGLEYSFKVVFGGVDITGTTTTVITAADVTFSDLEPGTYYIEATRIVGASTNCPSAPFEVVVETNPIDPALTFAVVNPNTACDPGDPDGVINMNVDTGVEIAGGLGYTIEWFTDIGLTTSFQGPTNIVSAGPGDPVQDNLVNAPDDDYYVKVINPNGCVTVDSRTIQSIPDQISITGTTFTPQQYCDMANPQGVAQVTGITLTTGGVTAPDPNFAVDYTYRWYSSITDFNTASAANFAPGNGELADSDEILDLGGPGVASGTYYVVAIKDPLTGSGSGCTTGVAQVDITLDVTFPAFDLVLTQVNDACDPLTNPNSVITGTFSTTGGPGDDGFAPVYTITWNGAALDPLPTPTSIEAIIDPNTRTWSDVQPGNYTAIITNSITNCTSVASIEVTSDPEPIVITEASILKNDLRYCDLAGNVVPAPAVNDYVFIEVPDAAVSPGVVADYTFQWFKDAPDVVTGIDLTATEPLILNTTNRIDYTNYPGITSGTYYFIATRNPGLDPGSGCETTPIRVDILEDKTNPVFDLVLTQVNDACDPLANPNAIITGTFSTTGGPGDDGLAPVYTITWNGAALDPLPTPTSIEAIIDPNTRTWSDVQPGNYTAIITNSITNCTSVASIEVTSDPEPIVITEASILKNDLRYCDLAGNVVPAPAVNDYVFIEVPDAAISPGVVADYTFQWFKDAPNAAPGIDLTATEPLIINTTNRIDYTNYPGITSGTYYFIATRNPGLDPGSGCETTPIRVDILEDKTNPVFDLVLTQVNDACDPLANPNAIITGTFSTTGGPGDDGLAPVYTITWNGAALDPLPTPTSIEAIIDPNTRTWSDVQPGNYTAIITNSITNCTSVASIEVISDPEPIVITEASIIKNDLRYCDLAGNVVPAPAVNDYVFIEVPDAAVSPGVVADYTFQWFKDAPDVVTGIDLTATEPLILNTTNRIDYTNYPGITSGTYYFIATRNPGLDPGSGCETTPIRVDILEDITNPVFDLVLTQVNDACDPLANPNAIITGTFSTTGGPGDDGLAPVYTITWNGAALDPLPTPTSIEAIIDPNTRTWSDVQPGNYTAIITNSITNCTSLASIEVTSDPEPIVITEASIIKNDLRYCDLAGNVVPAPAVNDYVFIEVPDAAVSPGVVADYTFQWFKDAPDVVTGIDLTATEPLILNTTNRIDYTNYPGITSGTYYFIATRNPGLDPGSGCETTPIRVDILEDITNPVFDLVLTQVNDACDPLANPNAIITGTFSTTGGPGDDGNDPDYEVTWTVISGGAGGNTPMPSPELIDNSVAGGTYQWIDIEPGEYKAVIRNTLTNCTSESSIEVTSDPEPIVITEASIIKNDLRYCDLAGNIVPAPAVNDYVFIEVPDAAVSPGVVADYTFQWFKDAPDAVTGIDLTATEPLIINTTNRIDYTNYPGITSGTYYFIATRNPGLDPGSGCETTPIRVDILEDITNPVFDLELTQVNDACDNNWNSEITATFETLAGPGADGFNPNYEITWTILSGGGGGSTPLPSPDIIPSAGVGGTTFVWNNIEPGEYQAVIRNTLTNCTATASVEVVVQPAEIVLNAVDYNKEDLTYCLDPLSLVPLPATTDYAYIEIASISPGNPGEYTFSWYLNDPNSAPLETSPGVPITGPILDYTTYPTIADGLYYVVAQRNAGLTPGSSCESSPLAIEIFNEPRIPEISFTATSNTACDLAFANGELSAAVTINGNSLSPGSTFSWFVGPDIFSPPFVDGVDGDLDQSFVSQEILRNISPGVYTVMVFDAATGCDITRNYNVDDLPSIPNISLQNITVTPQDICDPSGAIIISDGDISIGGNPGLVEDFLFSWSFDSPVNPPLDSLGTDGLPSGLPIEGPILNASIYEFMGAGDYYVTIKAKMGEGAGCPGPPQKVTVDDISTDPQIDFVTTPNSACPGGMPNGVIVATAQEVDGTTTDPYTYTWTVGGVPVDPLTITDAGNTSTVIDAVDGDYSLTVFNANTGCSFTRGFTLILDRTLSEPNIIRVDKVDPIDCNPTARMEVVEIQLGGQPANVGDFEYRWYADAFDPANIILTDPLDPLSPPVNTPNLENVAIGKYFVTALELNTNCESLAKEVNILDVNIIYPTVEIFQDSPQTSCDPATPNGQLSALADGAFDDSNSGGNYTFTWFDDTSTQIGTGSTIADLDVGVYSVEVTNNTTGCTATTAFIVEDGTELSRLQVSLSTEPVTFCDTNNGVAEARIANHNIGNWEFTWTGPNGFSAIEVGNTSRLDNVEPGTYTASAIDLDGNYCPSLMKTVVVEDQRVPPPIDMIVDSQLTNCYVDQPNGQITASAGGTITGFEFNWYTGTTAAGSIIGTNNIISNLPLGSYTVEIIDRFTNCGVSDFREIEDATVLPPTPGAEVLNNLTDCLNPDGALEIVYDGNPTDFDFFWYDGSSATGTPANTETTYSDLDLGDYTTTVMDLTTGCVSEGLTVSIEDERVFPEFETKVTNANCETSNGIIELQFETDYGVREVLWYDETGVNVGAGQILLDQPTGDYTFEIVTFKNCEAFGAESIGTEITNYNGISANNDGANDGFEIDCITLFPNNNVKIFNRAGVKVYEADGYNNDDIIFDGIGLDGIYLAGQDLPDGTYFYVIDKGDGSRPVTGYLELIR